MFNIESIRLQLKPGEELTWYLEGQWFHNAQGELFILPTKADAHIIGPEGVILDCLHNFRAACDLSDEMAYKLQLERIPVHLRGKPLEFCFPWDDKHPCDICEKPFTDDEWEDRHWPHEENCAPLPLAGCDCEKEVHSYCCPGCKRDISQPHAEERT